MATLYGDVKTTKYHTGETHERAYITYSTSSTDTVFTISGTVYLRAKQYSWDYDVSSVYASLDSASITVSSGTVSKSGDGTLVHLLKLNTAYDKAGYTFTATINKTHSSQSITLKLSAVIGITYLGSSSEFLTVTSSGSVAISVPAKTSYAVQYNANGGSGAPTSQTKWYNETLTLSSAKPTKSGYTFKGWATSTTIAASGTVNKAPGATYSVNEALTLYAVWELTYSKPSITNLSAERCSPDPDHPGEYILDDEGRYAQVSFDWSVFRSALPRYHGGSTAPYSENTVGNGGCTVTVGSDDPETPTLSGSSGSETVVVGTGIFDVDTAYQVTVEITDTQQAISPHTTTVTGELSATSFPLDVNADGTAIGLLGPAPDNKSGVFVSGVRLLDIIYPVGSIYMSVNSTSPQTLFGGSWSPINGRFLVAQGSNGASGDEALNLSAGASGGKAKQIIPYHRHSLGELTTGNNDKSHTHSPSGNGTHFLERNSDTGTQTRNKLNSNSSGSYYTWMTTNADGLLSATATGNQSQNHTHKLSSGQYTNYSADAANGTTPRTSDNASNANLPPYLAVYMWKRTG